METLIHPVLEWREARTEDERFMLEALRVAVKGRGSVEPNPMVGAVIVREGKILSRGWHEQFGGPHAEVQAFRAAERDGIDVRGATIYVTLEPCCHYGKTPPCTDAILRAGIARVVTALADPDHHVAGGGLQKLRAAGLTVDVGICEDLARQLLNPYLKLRTQDRPWVICKWAQTSDGYLALPPEAGRWISNPASRARVHALRSGCDGILIGSGTMLADDPRLTNRSGHGKQPVRVVLDSDLQISLESQLVAGIDEAPLLIVTTPNALAERHELAEALTRAGAELLVLPSDRGRIDLAALLDELGHRRWTHLLVEGGANVLESFLAQKLADELWVFVSPQPAPPGSRGLARFDISEVASRHGLAAPRTFDSDGDTLQRYLLSE